MTEKGTWNRVDHIDALTGLKRLDDESIDCVVTSPPYWRTRDYGVEPVKWPDGSLAPLGLEEAVEDYINHLVVIFDEVYRVLKSAGSLWINIGDVFALRPAISGNQPKPKDGCSRCNSSKRLSGKSLLLIPSRLALALMARGWILRNDIVWHKSNHMPESAKDRFARSWEHVLFFVKSRRYYFDLNAVRVPHTKPPTEPLKAVNIRIQPSATSRTRMPPRAGEIGSFHPKGKNPGDHWSIGTETRSMRSILRSSGVPVDSTEIPLRHGAIFPEALCEKPILAGCPADGVILDPFCGSGTTAHVAKRLGRKFIGFELNPEYVQLARMRLGVVG